MGPTMRMLGRVVREFAAGVDAGNAIRLGLPVRRDALPDGVARDAAGLREHGSPMESTAATIDASGPVIATSSERM